MKREFACLDKLYDIFGIPVYAAGPGGCAFKRPDNEGDALAQDGDAAFCESLICAAKQHALPILYLEDNRIFYGLFYSGRTCYCLGPVSRFSLARSEMKEYRASHNCSAPASIERMGMSSASKIMTLFYLFLTGRQLPEADISIVSADLADDLQDWDPEADIEFYQLSQSENNRSHQDGMDFENRLLGYITAGDTASVTDALYGSDTPDVSDFAEVSSGASRQMEYMLVTSITLTTRAAIAGGMNAEDAYVLGDVYLGKIEQCGGNVKKLTDLGNQMHLNFTRCVSEAKQSSTKNIHVEKCKDYIAKNLRKELKVADIADQIGVSRTYLTHKFTEEEGIGIQQYIMKERCDHAANLLKYSDYPIALIAEYFCFSSQSHFGSCFKKQYGMTPNEYRRLNSR